MPKDEILDGSTWTDVQPQKEEILDGSTWTEVKKKDVPAPKLESGSKATISSNGQSKSTSVSPIVSKPNPINQTSFTVSKENNFGIPNFQVQGIQKNTFQPLTEQQKAAGKKVLGEGTPLVEKKKVNIETPETSAKKSAILKAVTGKDISYDEVSRLSDVSNTDYAGILAAQKEKQKTDNTFATNPALQEEQRQEQVKQSEFLGNREFKVNNPQANVQILEQKNPTLLKDIADKTLELDEQRTAESFNKDKPVSQRFSKPKNDVPYKPFTDYLEVEELATVSPMELYETREKESDREKQFKYFKDRGADNVFNEYDNEQTAISYKQSELKKKYDTALKNLKAKYGEDINNVEIPQDDKDFVDIIAAQNGLKENYNLSKDLLKTDKYAEVNKTIQERANRQVEIDKTAKDDTWYKFGDEYNKLNNVVMNTSYGLIKDIASLPRFINGLAGGNDFNWTDKVADATARFTDAGMAYFNTPTDVQRDNVQDYAEVDGYRVFLDKKGNPTSLRDADNFMVNNDAKKEEIFSKYSDNKDKIKVKTDWIDGEQIMNQTAKIIGDMLVMIAEGGGIGAGIKGTGRLSRSARLLNLAENAKLTTSLAVISQMQNEMMNDAIDKGMSKEDAAKYAAISSAGVAAISLINPMEAQFLKNIKNVKSLASEEVTSFLNGNTTLADLSKKTIGAVIGNSAPEIAEEQFFEPVLQNVVNDSYKNQVGVNEQLDQTDVLGRENLAQSVLTATTTFLPSALESSKNMNSNSIKMNILENPENWMAIIDKKKELGIIEDDIYSAEVAAMQKAKKKYDTLKSEVKQGDRTKLAGLIGDKVAIESKLSDAPELKPKYENQVKEIDSKISNLTNGITEAPKIEQAGAINIQSQDFGAEAKQDAKIESAVIEIGGKIYEGKNHAEAILKAKADGQDISQVNRQAEGKFKLSDGTIIDRAESKTRFGQDRSELIIPQDEAAKQANKDYAKITRKPLSKIAEKIKLDENQVTPIKPINTGQEQNNIGGVQQTPENNQGFQQGDGQNVSNQSQVPQVEQEKINPALRDVESTAKLTDELYADNAKKAFIEGKINAFTMDENGLYLNTNGVRVVNGFKDNGNMDVFEASKVELTAEEKKELKQIEADRELGFEGTGERKRELAKKIFKRSLENSESLVSKAQPTSTTQSESNPALKEPSLDQQLQDINDGNTVTFEYKNESEVPEVFKGKISSKGETNGKPYVKVTMAKSLADFHLQEAPKSESLLSKEQQTTYSKKYDANESEVQQNNETEKQITEIKKVIEELESNPNSPFAKLVNLDEQKQKLAELQKKEAEVKKESAQPVLPETKAQKAANPRLSALPKKKAVPTEKVEEKVDNVEIKKLQEEIDSFDDEYNRLVDAVNKEDRKLNTPKSENEIKLNQLQDKINALIDKRNKLQEQQTPTQQSGEVVSGSVDNPALRDVESTAKALEGVIPKNESFAFAINTLPIEGIINYKDIKQKDYALSFERYVNSPNKIDKEVASAYKIYEFLKDGGKLPNNVILLNKNGEILDGNNRVKAQLALGITDFKYAVANEKIFEQTNYKTISEAYHKAKAEGSNPELVKAVESLVSKEQPTTQSEIEAKKADIGIGKVGNTEYEVKVDGVYYQGKKLNNPENKTHRQLIEADIERRRQEELTKIIQSVFPNTQLNEIVYHGTRTQDKFDTFDENKIGELDSGYFGRGFYFSPDKSYAEGYSKQYNGYTIAAILNLQNPLETDANKANTNISLEKNDGAIVRVGENLSPELNTTEYDANEIGEVVVKNSNQIHILSEKELSNIDKINAKYDAELKALEQQLAETEDVAREDQTVILDGLGVSKGTPQFQKSQEQHKEISQKNFETLIEKLKKPFANAFKNLNITTDLNDFNTKAEKQGIKPIEFTNKKGEVYGAKLPDGTIYINPEKLNANTPIHEFSHLWEQLMPNAWKKGLEIFKQTKTGKDLFEKLQKDGNYKNLSEEQLWSEAMNMLIGNLGESKYHSLPKGKLAEFVDWVKDTMSKFVNVVTGKKELNKEYDLKDFTNKVLGDLLGDKLLTPESVKAIDATIQYAKDYGRKSDFNADGTVKESVRKEIEEERKTIVEKAKADGTYMKAPNGEKTKLNEDQWVTTRTERFKDWFGDWENNPKEASKVVDENGEPLVVYHGTNSEFTEFKQNNRSYGSGDTYGFLGNGFYFTNNFDTADSYSNYSGNVLPVFLNIKKPYISTNWEHTSPSRQGSFAKDLGVSVGEETTFLKGKNHDGVISTDEDYAEYLIYNPNQIKSATNNVGTFSNESNDIRFQVKDGLKEFVEDAKKEGYTKQETIDYVKDNNPEINEQDVIDTWDAVNEKAVDEKKEASEIFEIVEKNEKAVMSRAFLATKITSKTKDAIKNIGLVYDVEKQPLAEKQALQLINEIGIEQAYVAVKNGKIRGGQAAVIYAVAVDQMQKKILESTNEEEISDLQEEQANILEEFGIQAKEGGQFNSMLYRIYKNYGLGYSLEYRKNQWKKQNDGKISPEVEAKFEELDKKLKEYEKQVSQLEKEKQEIEDKYNDSISKGEVDELLKAEYEKGKKSGILGKVSSQRKAKVERAKNQIAEGLEDFAKAIGSILSAEGLDRPSLTKALVKIGKGLIDGGFATAENVFDKIKENIKDKFGDAIDIANYEEDINDTFSKKPKTEDDKPKVSNSRIKEIVAARREEGLKTTIDDVVAELKNDFPDGTPDRVIRNEVTGYGKTKELKGGDDATVRKIKRMGRYQSIMEDILNNKRPLRSGTQRDKIEADERAKLKEIYEGLKNLPLDATDLSKQLKTAQDAIETHLKNSIEDLDRQIKTGERPVKNKPIETNPKIEELRAERDRLLKQRNEIDNPPKSNLEKLIDKAIDFTNKLNQAKKEGNKKDQKALQIQKEATDGSITNLVDAVIKMNINPTEVELARKIKAKEAEIAKLEEKLNNNDLSKPKNKEGVMSPELDDLTKQKNDLVKELAKRRSAEEQANLHSDTLQELQDNAEISGETQITKADVDNGLISDLVQAHIEKGTPIEDVQKQIFDELKSIFPDTTERQVRNAILKQGEFKSEPKEVQDLQKKLADLKSQARLQSAIEDVQAGIVRETKAKGEKSKEVQDLQKQLADAKKEALNKYPKVSAKDLEKQIARIEKSITEIKRRIENKEFVKKERIKKTFFSDENWREVNKKLTEAKREKLKAQKEYDIEFYKNELANRSNGEKIADTIIDIFGLAKALRATLDVSAPFRQGGKTIVTNNKAWRTGFKNMYAYMFNKRKFDNYLLDIENADDYLLMRESKLGITNIDAGLQAKEDLFAINLAKYTGGKLDWLADKEIKGVRIGNLNPHSASERAYSGFLNTLRITMFREGVKKLKDRGIYPEDNPKEYKDLAHYINNATGRGKNLLDGKTTTKLLNATLFSQKMIRANIAMFVNIANPNISWETRKMYIGNLIGFALYTQALNALGSIIINYFEDDDDVEKLSNLEYNPLKTDFLKLKRGESSDKRYDATAGYSIQLRTIARFIAGKKEKDGEIIKENRGKILSSFFENKMSPLASTIYKPLMLGYHPTEFGKKAEDVELKELPYIALETFTPLQISATIDDAIKIKNETDGALTGIDLLLGLHGFSVQEYNNSGSGSNRGSSRGSDSRGSTRGESSRGSNSRGTER